MKARQIDAERTGTDRRDAPRREQHTHDAADERDDSALDEQLTQQPPRGGANRRAHGQLALPRRGARQQQRAEVRADDEQEADCCREQHHQRCARGARDLVLQPYKANVPSSV